MKRILPLIIFLAISSLAIGQSCGDALYDDYSDASLWSHLGTVTNNVYISGGVCNFHEVADGRYDKLIRQLSFSLSSNYWKAELKFTLTAHNPTGNGVGHILFAAAAGNLDFFAYDSTMNYQLTPQDGISVMIQSPTPGDNNIDDWQFLIFNKLGAAKFQSPGGINADSTVNTYYVRLERTALDSSRLSVFTDSLFTVPLPGSPIAFAVDPSTAPLSYIQQGSQTSGNDLRMLSATIDNLNICDPQFTGINEVAGETTMSMYPNPADDALNIALSGTASNIEVYNTLGQKMYQENEAIGSISIDVSHYETGVYFLRTLSGSNLSVQKFMVQH